MNFTFSQSCEKRHIEEHIILPFGQIPTLGLLFLSKFSSRGDKLRKLLWGVVVHFRLGVQRILEVSDHK
jgi:hypothetical protein